jgi:hypothetical protein
MLSLHCLVMSSRWKAVYSITEDLPRAILSTSTALHVTETNVNKLKSVQIHSADFGQHATLTPFKQT